MKIEQKREIKTSKTNYKRKAENQRKKKMMQIENKAKKE